MSAQPRTIGNQLDAERRDSSQSLHLPARRLVTLQDLLAELQPDPQFAMLRTTAGHVASFLSAPVEKLAIDVLINIVPEFRIYLKQRHYKRNTANGYCNFARLLLRKATQLGWQPSNPELPREWEAIAVAVKRLKGARGVINFAIARGKTPANFSDDDMTGWLT